MLYYSHSLCALLFTVACATGRFGVDCDKKCHCKDVTADCQATNGHCKSGCAQHFTGDTCQGNLLGTFMFSNTSIEKTVIFIRRLFNDNVSSVVVIIVYVIMSCIHCTIYIY